MMNEIPVSERLATRERHDLVRAHATGSLAPEVLDDTPTASARAAAPRLSDPYRITLNCEIHLTIWQQPQPLANFDRNRNLSLRCDAHGSNSSL
jgi:hypothetical protein